MPSRPNRTVTLIVGGARSGKSQYAQKLAEGLKRVAFIATAQRSDAEMRRKIARHQAERPASWRTIEAPVDLEDAIRSQGGNVDLLIVDCLTVYVANLMRAVRQPQAILDRFQAVAEAIRAAKTSVVIVSNEVGCGVVPPFRAGRVYRDLLGELNQQIAQIADQVVLMVAGLPMTMKKATRWLR